MRNVSYGENFDLPIRGCKVDMDSCSDSLLTTRGKLLVEDNILKRCRMPGILIENDANVWFESGLVREMTGNTSDEGEIPLKIAPTCLDTVIQDNR